MIVASRLVFVCALFFYKMADEFYNDPLPRPRGIASESLARAKRNQKPVHCHLSHCISTCHAETECRQISTVPVGHKLIDARLELECSLRKVFNSDAQCTISWTIGYYEIVKYNLPLVLLLNRTHPGKKPQDFIAVAKHFGSVFALLRKYGVPKLVADNIVSFLAITNEAFTSAFFTAFAKQPRVPNEFRELLQDAKDAEYKFVLNMALPIGTDFPLIAAWQTQQVLLVGRDSGAKSKVLLATRKGQGHYDNEHIMLYYGQDVCSLIRLNDSEFYAKLPFNFPGIALLAYFDICPNIDTVELCFHQTFVNSCAVEKCFINDGDIAERGRAYKLVYRVADCQIPGIENWLILPIDRSMSLKDALHKSEFEECCDFVDVTHINVTTVRFKSLQNKYIEMPRNPIMLSWRYFNIFRTTKDGLGGKVFSD